MLCAPKPLHGDPWDVRAALGDAPIVPLFLSSPGLVALPSGPTVLVEHQRHHRQQLAPGWAQRCATVLGRSRALWFQCCSQRPLMPTAALRFGVFLSCALFPVTFVTPPFCVSSPPTFPAHIPGIALPRPLQPEHRWQRSLPSAVPDPSTGGLGVSITDCTKSSATAQLPLVLLRANTVRVSEQEECCTGIPCPQPLHTDPGRWHLPGRDATQGFTQKFFE